MTAPAASPFKFLDAYTQDDRAVFFGRDEEIETLYRLLGESRLVLVYGASGTGKTSLIQCGLTSKLSPTNWLPVNVRRGDDLNAALLTALTALAITPLNEGASVPEAVRSVYLDHLRPLFLIFDQFEELFVLGSKAEQDQFYATIQAVLSTDVSCRIIVSLREEYLAALDPFERAVPSLFDKRLRVETMTHSNVEKVILGTCAAHGITLEHGAETAQKIIAQLDEKHVGVALAYLQVYLDYLWRGATGAAGGAVSFTDAQVEAAGHLGDIMAGFLDEQASSLQTELEDQGTGIAKGGVLRLLDEFVTVSGTKQPSTAAEVAARLPSCADWLSAALAALQSRRLLRLVGDHYEIAHDALALRIAERRSSERKDLLEIEKVITDRREGFDRTKTYLTPDELKMVRLATEQKDPMTGDFLFVLADDDASFVKACRKKARSVWIWGWAKTFGWIVSGPFILFGLIFLVASNQDSNSAAPPPDPAQDRKFSTVDRELSVMMGGLNGVLATPDLFDLLKQISATDWSYDDYSSFMPELRMIDENAIRNAPGFDAQYEKMAGDYEDIAQRPEARDSDWVKAKVVRWHQYWFGKVEDRPRNAIPLLKLLRDPRVKLTSTNALDIAIQEKTKLPAGFMTDADVVCGDLTGRDQKLYENHPEFVDLCDFETPISPVPEAPQTDDGQ